MTQNFTGFEAALNAAVAEGRIAGAVAVVTDRAGVTYEAAGGMQALGGSTPMDQATVFWIASMTKAIASVAALQQVERGALTLDGELSAHLPEFGGLQVLEGFDEAGQPRLRAPKRPVTLRHLLTHTSGFSYPFFSADLTRYVEAAGAAPQGSRAGYLQPLAYDPGEAWGYGVGIDWAGLAVEAVTGQRLGDYLAAEITGPLGMSDTAFDLTPEQTARKAGMHMRGPDGGLIPMPFELAPDREVQGGGGDLFGTLADYAKFARMLMNEGAGVLKPETVALLATPQTGAIRAGAMATSNPFYSLDYDPFPGQPSGWGLTGVINPEPGPNGRSAGSLAWAGLANTYYVIDRKAGISAILGAQLLPFGDPVVLELFGALERGAFGKA